VVHFPGFGDALPLESDEEVAKACVGACSVHAKLILLEFEDRLRVALTTANLKQKSWCFNGEAVWVQDFPRGAGGPDAGRLLEAGGFARVLGHFVADLLTASHGNRQGDWIARLASFDFSGVAQGVRLIASLPGFFARARAVTAGQLSLRLEADAEEELAESATVAHLRRGEGGATWELSSARGQRLGRLRDSSAEALAAAEAVGTCPASGRLAYGGCMVRKRFAVIKLPENRPTYIVDVGRLMSSALSPSSASSAAPQICLGAEAGTRSQELSTCAKPQPQVCTYNHHVDVNFWTKLPELEQRDKLDLVIKGTWRGHCKAHEIFQAAYKSKPGFPCKLRHGSDELSPQSALATLCLNCARLTVVWMRGAAQNKQFPVTRTFAAIKSDGSVIAWGNSDFGGDCSCVEHRLQEDVVQVGANGGAFAAIKSDGSVITWGHSDLGGNSSRVEHRLQEGVVQIVSSKGAFAAIKSNGSVITWGGYESDSSLVEHRLQDGVVQIVGNSMAFAAIKSDGSVITWGDSDFGGDSSHVEHRLQEGIVQVVGSEGAFAAVKSDGSVIAWGNSDFGGNTFRVEHRLQEGVEQVVGNSQAFAAIKSDGSVITWGDGDLNLGGDSSLVEHRLQEGVVRVVGNGGAFAAIKSDGSVITWGHSDSGGDSSRVVVTVLFMNIDSKKAFAALKSDGSVITWGNSGSGGDSSLVEHRLQEGVNGVVS
ncbi:unnamed protein product, partial [Polarella glacialis]